MRINLRMVHLPPHPCAAPETVLSLAKEPIATLGHEAEVNQTVPEMEEEEEKMPPQTSHRCNTNGG